MTHAHIPSYALPPRPQLAADAELLSRATVKVGADWSWAGAFLFAGRVSAA